jgi:hypothetical protein
VGPRTGKAMFEDLARILLDDYHATELCDQFDRKAKAIDENQT